MTLGILKNVFNVISPELLEWDVFETERYVFKLVVRTEWHVFRNERHVFRGNTPKAPHSLNAPFYMASELLFLLEKHKECISCYAYLWLRQVNFDPCWYPSFFSLLPFPFNKYKISFGVLPYGGRFKNFMCPSKFYLQEFVNVLLCFPLNVNKYINKRGCNKNKYVFNLY